MSFQYAVADWHKISFAFKSNKKWYYISPVISGLLNIFLLLVTGVN